MKIVDEFKEFIARGNVMDMAVGIIVGGAFTARPASSPLASTSSPP